jgi:hypothetical protein
MTGKGFRFGSRTREVNRKVMEERATYSHGIYEMDFGVIAALNEPLDLKEVMAFKPLQYKRPKIFKDGESRIGVVFNSMVSGQYTIDHIFHNDDTTKDYIKINVMIPNAEQEPDHKNDLIKKAIKNIVGGKAYTTRQDSNTVGDFLYEYEISLKNLTVEKILLKFLPEYQKSFHDVYLDYAEVTNAHKSEFFDPAVNKRVWGWSAYGTIKYLDLPKDQSDDLIKYIESISNRK